MEVELQNLPKRNDCRAANKAVQKAQLKEIQEGMSKLRSGASLLFVSSAFKIMNYHEKKTQNTTSTLFVKI